jgi:hypothetical protein
MKNDLSGLKSLESLFVIVGSVLLLGMSYGFIAPSMILVIIITVGGLITSTIYINNMTKEEFSNHIDKDIGIYDKFMKLGPVIGPIRIFLIILILLTLITFNLYAWQVWLAAYIYITFIITAKVKHFGLEDKIRDTEN